jgi:hypothetical protein
MDTIHGVAKSEPARPVEFVTYVVEKAKPLLTPAE